MIRFRFAFALVLTAGVFPFGCGKDPDATGDAGIGAPGKYDPSLPVLSDEDAMKEQLKREAEISRKSR